MDPAPERSSSPIAPPSAAPAAPVPELRKQPQQSFWDAPGRALACFAAVVAVVSLLGPIARSGIWEPPELQVAEFGRRIALNLLGGHGLALDGSNNDVPTRGDLGRGELPFSSIALGFRLFGLHDWAGRLPLALWALLGAGAVYVLVKRLADRGAAAGAVLVLATTPLYFLHARTMLGDIVTMSAASIAITGFALAVFDRERGRSSLAWRGLAFAVGLLGAVSGLMCRGVLVGVAVPTLGVGLAWLTLRAAGTLSRERPSDGFGVALLAVGAVAAVLGVRALLLAPSSGGAFSLLLGSAVSRARVLPTFDVVLLQLGHALFPWSAFAPLALGRLLRLPPSLAPAARERESGLRAVLLLGSALGILAYGLNAPVVGVPPFAEVALLASACGIALRDIERGAPASRALPLVVAAFAIVFLADFKNTPEKLLSAFCVADARFPDSFKVAAERWLTLGTLAFSAVFFFATQERTSEGQRRFDLREYRAWPRQLAEVWGGNLQFGLLVLEAGLLGVVALGAISDRYWHLRQFETMTRASKSATLYAALGVLGAVFAPIAVLFARDVFRALCAPGFGSRRLLELVPALPRAGLPRARIALLAGVIFAGALSLGFYPALAAQISPKRVFASYRAHAKPGEALGLIGASSETATYYAGRKVVTFAGVPAAFNWLVAVPERRWLMIRATDLGAMNSLFRARQRPPQNLPVEDAESSEILLVSNQLGARENQNPLESVLLGTAPKPQHPLDASFGDTLDTLGWEVQAPDGKRVDVVQPGRSYDFLIYYRVRGNISGNWETFVHIDGFQRRFNADHPTLGGKYPFNLWHAGDYIVDRYRFALEPNFSPGEYRVYYGLYTGERRLEVRRGRHSENRLEAGFLQVR